MTLLSASEDLWYRTLSAFDGILQKFAYVVSLRDQSGRYRHWGMDRTYGEQTAEAAIAEVHTRAWIDVLRTPVPELVDEISGMDAVARQTLIEELENRRRLSCPADLSGGTVRHFNSILLALEYLSRSADATHQAA